MSISEQGTSNEQHAKRNTKRIATDELQGAGSWIEIRVVTFGEGKRIRAETLAAEGDQDAQIALAERLIWDHLVNWSWCDYEGQLLPLPQDDQAVLDRLTLSEIAFLVKAITGTPDPK